MYALNYEGLKKRDTYDEIIDYLQNKQDKIKYPDRTAKQLRNSPQLSNLLDGEGLDYEDMNKQQKNRIKEVEKENIIRNIAIENNETAHVLRTRINSGMKIERGSDGYPVMKEQGVGDAPEIYDMAVDDDDDDNDIIDFYDNENEEAKRKQAERNAAIRKHTLNILSGTARVMAGSAYYTAVGAYKGASFLYNLKSGEKEDEEDPQMLTLRDTDIPPDDDPVLSSSSSSSTSSSSSSNSDLGDMTLDELRNELLGMRHLYIGISKAQVEGTAYNSLSRKRLIEAIKKLRSR